MEFIYVTKSILIFFNPEQHTHLKKIQEACRWTYNWTIERLLENNDLTVYDLYKMFTIHKHEHPEIVNMVQVKYHQYSIQEAHKAYTRAKKDNGYVKWKRKKSFGVVNGQTIEMTVGAGICT